jgi:hypothetical protein
MRGEHAMKVVGPVAIKTRDIAEILAERRLIAPSPEFLPPAPSGTR